MARRSSWKVRNRMPVIRECKLEITPEQAILTDTGYAPVAVQCRNGELVLGCWSYDGSAGHVRRKIVLLGTGEEPENPFAYPGDYLGTVQMPDGFVWHVFDKGIGYVP